MIEKSVASSKPFEMSYSPCVHCTQYVWSRIVVAAYHLGAGTSLNPVFVSLYDLATLIIAKATASAKPVQAILPEVIPQWP